MKHRLIAVCAALALGLVALASWDGVVDSVHFYSGSYWATDRVIDFGRVPMRVDHPGWNSELNRAADDQYGNWEQEEADAKKEDARCKRVALAGLRLLEKGRLEAAAKTFATYDDSTDTRSYVRDLREAAAVAHGAPLQGYLKACWTLEFGGLFSKDLMAPKKALEDPNMPLALKPHALYALAAANTALFRQQQAAAFEAVARRFPKSPRAPAALLSAARTLLSDDAEPRSASGTEHGRDILKRLIKTYPRSPYVSAAQGWLARAEFLLGNSELALKTYRRQLVAAKDPVERWHAYESIAIVANSAGHWDGEVIDRLHQYGDSEDDDHRTWSAIGLRKAFRSLDTAQAARVQRSIRADASLLAAYVRFRIECTSLEPVQERNLATFATRALRRLQAGPELLARIAQIDYNCGRYKLALELGRRASSSEGDAGIRGRYVTGAALARLGRNKEAIKTYEALIRIDGPKYLKQSAIEALALLHERFGDPVRALALYRQIGYEKDVAFLADARLTPGQLERFIATLPKSSKAGSGYVRPEPEAIAGPSRSERRPAKDRGVFIYTLGMRYLRKGQYAQAESTFQRLTKPERLHFGLTPKDYKELTKNWWGWDALPVGRDPMDTLRTMRAFRQKADAGTGDARAQALYGLAAYLYKNRNLLFYSPGLWKGERAFSVDMFWTEDVNNDADQVAMVRHAYEHEALEHAVQLCREIVKKHPKSPVLPKALYTGALANERLGNLNGWWRNRRTPLLKTAVAYLTRLQQQFPQDPLAKPAAKYRDEFAGMMSPNWGMN